MIPDGPDDDVIAVYDGLLRQALREIRSPAVTQGQRAAWGDVAKHVLARHPETPGADCRRDIDVARDLGLP